MSIKMQVTQLVSLISSNKMLEIKNLKIFEKTDILVDVSEEIWIDVFKQLGEIFCLRTNLEYF